MKNTIYLISLLVMSLAFVGCSKSKKGGGDGQVYAYAPNSCYNNGNQYNYNNGYNYNQFNQYNNNYQYNQRYQMRNGQCVDVQDGGAVRDYNLCQNINYSYNQNCTYYGQGNGVYTGHVSGAYNACSIYNTAYEQFYPIYYPNLGTTVCAGYSTFSYISGYGNPYLYGNYNNVYRGCTPGYGSSYGGCKCKTLGGSLGWFSAGITMGVCYY